MTLEEFAGRLEALAEVTAKKALLGMSDPDAARILRVLEYGSVAGQPPWPRPGPRTVLAVDPETGAQVVVSARAPQGFIRVRVPEFLEALRAELTRGADWLEPADLEAHVGQAVSQAARAALEALRAALPRGSRRLAESLTITIP